MEAARAAVAEHTARKGHFTQVEETVRPAVTWETIKPHRHEEITEAVDREVHQHHYHTTVQPISHTEILPTKHTHNLLPVKQVKYQHDDEVETQRRVDDLAAKFRNTSVTIPTTHSHAQLPAVVGEHYHHHVHETVQPVIHKETIQREIVHTTIPIHEVHHAVSTHHTMSALPLKQLSEFLEFQKGRQSDGIRRSHHDGPPKEYDPNLLTDFEKLGMLFESESNAHSRNLPEIDTASGTKHTNIMASHNSRPAADDTVETNSRLLQRKSTPPRLPFRSDQSTPLRSSDRDAASPASGGGLMSSRSSSSSLSSSAPPTPNSPTYRDKIAHKPTIMDSTNHSMSPNTGQNNTTLPSKDNQTYQPVTILNDSETSPRYSDETPTRRRSFLARLTGRGNHVSQAS